MRHLSLGEVGARRCCWGWGRGGDAPMGADEGSVGGHERREAAPAEPGAQLSLTLEQAFCVQNGCKRWQAASSHG